ncbi:MAG: hypothetical protein QXL78_05310 [Methanocellales archaeon]
MATYEITCKCGYREQIWIGIAMDMELADLKIQKCPQCSSKLTVKMIYYDRASED